ncbi:MAG: NADAR family protein [Chromatiales bacterium]|nr:NADAR family protein [Chromatiales bacterium]
MNPTRAAAPASERIDRFRGEHAFLSNFHRAPFRWQGKTWATAEAPFQASKTRDERLRERIRAASSPGEAKRLGRRADLRCEWERIKDDVMLSVLQAKFAVPELRDALLATGDAELVEGNTWGDVYWGVCDGRGRNQLGRTLMRIREDIRRRAGPAMDGQHADWLRDRCDLERAGRCDRDVCRKRSGWRHDAGDAPSCIPLEILRRLERAEAHLPDAADL